LSTFKTAKEIIVTAIFVVEILATSSRIVFSETIVANAMFLDNALVWIVVEAMSKKHRVHMHWKSFKTQRDPSLSINHQLSTVGIP
jgi:positive regulator of sigma E activity